MKKALFVLAFFILYSCSSNIHYVYAPSKQDNLAKAIKIIINDFDKRKIFTKDQMLDVLQKKFVKKHNNCKEKRHDLQIYFVSGEWSEEYNAYCIYSDTFKGACLIGLFDGMHTITVVNSKNNKIHNTAFAHEMFHYFQRYISDVPTVLHEPAHLWRDLVGYKIRDKIGLTNEVLKNEGL